MQYHPVEQNKERTLFFPRTTRDWNQLDNTIVHAPSLEAFKSSCQSTSIDFLCNARLRCVNARQLDVAAYYYIYRQTDTGYPCLLQMTVTLTFEWPRLSHLWKIYTTLSPPYFLRLMQKVPYLSIHNGNIPCPWPLYNVDLDHFKGFHIPSTPYKLSIVHIEQYV